MKPYLLSLLRAERALADRIFWLYAAQRRARQLGFTFFRRKTFAVPKALLINGNHVNIICPRQRGCVNDFIEVFLGDSYNLEFVKRTFGDSRTIVDIGANVGWFSLAAPQPKSSRKDNGI